MKVCGHLSKMHVVSLRRPWLALARNADEATTNLAGGVGVHLILKGAREAPMMCECWPPEQFELAFEICNHTPHIVTITLAGSHGLGVVRERDDEPLPISDSQPQPRPLMIHTTRPMPYQPFGI